MSETNVVTVPMTKSQAQNGAKLLGGTLGIEAVAFEGETGWEVRATFKQWPLIEMLTQNVSALAYAGHEDPLIQQGGKPIGGSAPGAEYRAGEPRAGT